MKRVVVTGMGIVSGLGSSVKEAFERLHIAKNCVQYSPKLEEYKGLNTKLIAPVSGFNCNIDRKFTRTMGKAALYGAVSAQDAVQDAGLGQDILTNGQTGVAYGSSVGAMERGVSDFVRSDIEKDCSYITACTFPIAMSHTAAANISLLFNTAGRCYNASVACASGAMAIGMAYEAIKNEVQTVMIAGGAEEAHFTMVETFDVLFSASLKNSTPELTPSPFDVERDGIVVGEGAATLVLEEYEHAKKRGAKIYAEVLGFGTNTDGKHITSPNRATQGKCFELALQDANINADDICYINAHGTGTTSGDICESLAVADVFKRAVPISSIKSYTGHTLAASGAIEALLTIEMARNNLFCPTLNLNEVDSACADLDYIKGEGREIKGNIVMSNNFAFGGVNTSLIFKEV
ncbi:MAG: beta-ketoacyl-ACP synthase [Heliobacteriaceae bacterium]|jgi:3-oxoacyl-[acyl-carrier-protein] synthase II|nr:beta-ketoacyl-ACP synthase [Heliobacteriaceae bacterium]